MNSFDTPSSRHTKGKSPVTPTIPPAAPRTASPTAPTKRLKSPKTEKSAKSSKSSAAGKKKTNAAKFPSANGSAPHGSGLVTSDDYLTPAQIVKELDKYIVGQAAAKKSVSIALRNRWRRRRAADDIRDEILPNNILMIGPTGVGKTEIARRLADLVGAPFVKVEASKYTEVGYVGRDVESMVRDLVELSITMVRKEQAERVSKRAEEQSIERILDLLLPKQGQVKRAMHNIATPVTPEALNRMIAGLVGGAESGSKEAGKDFAQDSESLEPSKESDATRTSFRKMLLDGSLDSCQIELNVIQQHFPVVEVFAPQGMEELGANFREMFSNLMPQKSKRRKMSVAEARKSLLQEEISKLVNMDDVTGEALKRAQESGIIFLDEIDKVVGVENKSGPDVSRGGVQRDILPIVEGCTVSTKHGIVKTDHILFIAAGAFHSAKPSDLIPELQGRFPIRVELEPLTAKDFERILVEPKNALTKQYTALLLSEGVALTFDTAAITKMAEIAETVNNRTENIGARRLQTILSTLLEDTMFETPSGKKTVHVTEKMVIKALSEIVEDEDLSRYML